MKDLFRRARAAADHDPDWIFAATSLGGSFGREKNGGDHEAHGGAAGFLRSLAKEKPDSRIRCVDLDITEDPEELAQQLFDEILTVGSEVEVGHATGTRRSLQPIESSLGETDSTTPLDGDSVVLLTGGARGITELVAN